ncbi:MAG: bifunctional hydroxymethylpyrimidine kinase/phosphomethylpyrimidine kinase [Gammaproteobacteria bacterium]|nr:bifunctional hydroxymethylpyrimidine kinase/phosphomethylpyrimidine kinase [Gammaproteobacteria bacterium]
MSDIPVVLCLAGLDPSGGAGLQADIESLASMGCHATSVITAITVQDTRNVISFQPVEAELVMEQARAILEDIPIDAIKIGMLGSIDNAEVIHSLLQDYPDIPVVLDPILKAGGGSLLAAEELIAALRSLLLPLATLITPNSEEARQLAHEADNLPACAEALQDLGSRYVLITGSHEPTAEVINTLYGDHRLLKRYPCKRLEGEYHGSGCTLSAAITGLLAQGIDIIDACRHAQEYTWASLQHGYRIGNGQWIPDRFSWSDHDEEP